MKNKTTFRKQVSEFSIARLIINVVNSKNVTFIWIFIVMLDKNYCPVSLKLCILLSVLMSMQLVQFCAIFLIGIM